MTARLRAAVAAMALGVSFLARPAFAVPATGHAPPSWLRPESDRAPAAPAAGSPWRIGLVLTATGGVLVTAWFARRMRKARAMDLPVAEITVLASKRIGPKSQAVIVEAGGRVLLLGVSDSQISRLYRLRNLETKQRAAAANRESQGLAPGAARPADRARRFADLLDTMLDHEERREPAPAELLAGATRDVVSRDPRRAEPAARDDWGGEEQTLGLVSRLGRRAQ